eukprot:scaffold7468_cov277-Pinguiococcus_pyrenoidosus.AAC.1
MRQLRAGLTLLVVLPPLEIVASEISSILNTGLSEEALAILMQLCEAGVNPEALAAVVKELRQDPIDVALSE